MNFKAIGFFIIFLIGVISGSLNSAFAGPTKASFITKDNYQSTQLCLAAVTNNVAKTKHHLSILAPHQANLRPKVQMVMRAIQCNGMNLIDFSAKYQAIDTFNYLNKRASGEYKIDVNKVSISDLANHISHPAKFTLSHDSSVVVVTSR